MAGKERTVAGPDFTVGGGIGVGLSALAKAIFPDASDVATARYRAAAAQNQLASAAKTQTEQDILLRQRRASEGLSTLLRAGTPADKASVANMLAEAAVTDPQFAKNLLPFIAGRYGMDDPAAASTLSSLTGVQEYENTPTGFAQTDATRRYGYQASAGATIQSARIAAAQRAAAAAAERAQAERHWAAGDLKLGAGETGYIAPARLTALGLPAGPVRGLPTESTATGQAIERYTAPGGATPELADVVAPTVQSTRIETTQRAATEAAKLAETKRQFDEGDIKAGAGDTVYLSPGRQAAMGLPAAPVGGMPTESTVKGQALKDYVAKGGAAALAEIVAPTVVNAREAPVNAVLPGQTQPQAFPRQALPAGAALAKPLEVGPNGVMSKPATRPILRAEDVENMVAAVAERLGLTSRDVAETIPREALDAAISAGTDTWQTTRDFQQGVLAAAQVLAAQGGLVRRGNSWAVGPYWEPAGGAAPAPASVAPRAPATPMAAPAPPPVDQLAVGTQVEQDGRIYQKQPDGTWMEIN